MINAWSKLPSAVRKKYQDTFPVPVIDIANDLDIKVFETDSFENSQSGSIAYEQGTYVIYVNQDHPNTRKRFSIAHEIGHFLLHKAVIKQKSELITDSKTAINGLERSDKPHRSDEEALIEKQANEFAADLIMPEEAFKQTFNAAHDISEVAEKFKVSQSAATIRAQKLLGQFFT